MSASSSAAKPLGKQFANTEEGHRALIGWLRHRKLGQVHACLEATGRYSLGIGLALHAAGHIVSIVNPAQIRDFVRTRLGRNKTDQVDCAHIRDFAVLFNPPAWQPPSPALRRLCDLQTMRAGFVASKVEWQNRAGSIGADAAASALAQATIAHFVARSLRSIRRLRRPSMTTTSCAASASCCSASTASAKPWPRSSSPNCRTEV